MFHYKGSIIQSNSREQALAIASKSSGIRLYFLSKYDEAYLIAFYCGDAKQLKKLGFEIDTYYYIKPLNTATASDLKKYSIESDGYAKLKKFKNPNALKEIKKQKAVASNSVEVWYAIIENQGMLVSIDKLVGFLKVPHKTLYKEITSVSMAKTLIEKIQKIAPISNLDDLSKVFKVYFGTGLDFEKKPEAKNYDLEFTHKFLKEQYDLFNERYFGNGLPKDLPISWETTSGRAGACYWRYVGGEIKPTEIKMSRNVKTYNEFRNTLVHEMCHANCYMTISPEKIKEADKLGPANSTKWKRYLELTDDTAHNGRFAWLTDRLNSKYPELNLGRFSHNDHANKDENGNLKSGVLDRVASAHLLVRDDQEKKTLFFVSNELYEKILENIKSEVYSRFPPYRGAWIEYRFDPEIISRFTTSVSDTLSTCLRYKCLGEIRRIGALKGGIKFLGGSSNARPISPWDVRQTRP